MSAETWVGLAIAVIAVAQALAARAVFSLLRHRRPGLARGAAAIALVCLLPLLLLASYPGLFSIVALLALPALLLSLAGIFWPSLLFPRGVRAYVAISIGLDDLRRAYDRGAPERNTIEDLQWRLAALETWQRAHPGGAQPRLTPGECEPVVPVSIDRATARRFIPGKQGLAWPSLARPAPHGGRRAYS